MALVVVVATPAHVVPGMARCAAVLGADVAETAAEPPDDVCIIELHPTQQQA